MLLPCSLWDEAKLRKLPITPLAGGDGPKLWRSSAWQATTQRSLWDCAPPARSPGCTPRDSRFSAHCALHLQVIYLLVASLYP